MQEFIYDIGTKVIFGQGKSNLIGTELAGFGAQNVLLVYGKDSIKKNGLYDVVMESLKENNLNVTELSGIKPNPSIESVRAGQKIMQENKIDFILAVGGGSVVDAAKAILASQNYAGDPWDLIAKGVPVPMPDAKLGTIITLAATGSEMNFGSVISNEQTNQKLVIIHPKLRPVITIEDPTLMYSLPAYQTAAGASDILSHLLEQYFSSHKDEGLLDRMTEGMMKNVIEYAPIAVAEPNNYEARAQLMWTSTLALNNMISLGKEGADWLTHLIEHEVSAYYDITHGAGLAIIHPHTLEMYLEKDIQANLDIVKFVNLGKNVFNLTGTDLDVARESLVKLREFFNLIKMPSQLSQENVNEEHFTAMAESVIKMQGSNYHSLTKEEIVAIYNSAR